jgi:hypothetical protein
MKKDCLIMVLLLIILPLFVYAQSDDKEEGEKENSANKIFSFSRLQLGGYGEATMSRNFYSGNPFRYMYPEKYKNDPSHGRFDLPHVVFFIGYEFGDGWRVNSEIEFEHGGTEAAIEVEAEEGGEYEQEVERGGEVVLEQFWIEKTITKAFNIRVGHLVVPIGYTNNYHLPTQFFTVYRPEGENSIMPCTWHETGISIWGRTGSWRYEAMVIPGLDSELFSNREWIGGASASPYEFKIANTYAGVLRIDNYSVPGLRVGLSGYYGYSFKNSIMPSYADKYKDIKGEVAIGAIDFEYKGHNIIARGNFDYGHLNDAQTISIYNRGLPNLSLSSRTNVATAALATGIEAGYDIFSFIKPLKEKKQKCYLFGRYELYDSMYETAKDILQEEWCGRKRIVGGLNYFPLKEIVVKAEYSAGLLKSPYNNEPSFSFSVAYGGFFN